MRTHIRIATAIPVAVLALLTAPCRAGETDTAPTNGPWQLDLTAVMVRAAESSITVRQAIERVREQEGTYKVDRSKLLPKLYALASQKRQDRSTAGYGLPESSTAAIPEPIPFEIKYPGLSSDLIRRFNLPTEGFTQITEPTEIIYDYSDTTGAYDFFDASLRLGVPLYDRELYTKFKASREALRRVDLEVDFYREEAMATAAQLFHAVLVQQKSMEALQGKVDLHLDKVAEIQDLLTTGNARPLDVKKEEVALAGARNSLLEATKRKAAALRELKRFLDIPPEDEVDIIGDLFLREITLPDRKTALEQAMTDRLDVQLQQYRERIAGLQRDAVRYSRHPDLRGMGSYGRQGNTPDDTVDAWMIGISASIPVWDSFERRGKIEVKESQYQQERYQTEDLVKAVESELDLLRDELGFAASSVRVLEQSVDYLEENRQYLEDKVTAGTGKRIDLLSAEVDLAQAEYKLVEAVFNHEIIRIQWLKSLGLIETAVALPDEPDATVQP